jgi:hypothetical protein
VVVTGIIDVVGVVNAVDVTDVMDVVDEVEVANEVEVVVGEDVVAGVDEEHDTKTSDVIIKQVSTTQIIPLFISSPYLFICGLEY